MGCTLNYTAEDHRQALKTWGQQRASRADEKLGAKERDQIRSALQRTSARRMSDILSDPKHRAHAALSGMLAKSIGAERMTDEELRRVPEVFQTILKHHPDAMGLFEKVPAHRGPGSSPVQHHYEVFSAAAMMQKCYQTASGKQLAIAPMDRLDFGVKFAKGYGQPYRHGTIEADILIHKQTPFGLNDKAIAIDAKHSSTGNYGITKGLDRELEGIRTGFRDGKFDEFCFVTNGRFGERFVEMVKDANLKVARDYARIHNRLYQDEKKGIHKAYLTEEERRNIPAGKVDESLFDRHSAQVVAFVRTYDVSQIDICQHVKFPGT